jgi:hypothetical protein
LSGLPSSSVHSSSTSPLLERSPSRLKRKLFWTAVHQFLSCFTFCTHIDIPYIPQTDTHTGRSDLTKVGLITSMPSLVPSAPEPEHQHHAARSDHPYPERNEADQWPCPCEGRVLRMRLLWKSHRRLKQEQILQRSFSRIDRLLILRAAISANEQVIHILIIDDDSFDDRKDERPLF